MGEMVKSGRTKADILRGRAEELRELAGQLKSDEHKRLLLCSADNYQRLADMAAIESGARIGSH